MQRFHVMNPAPYLPENASELTGNPYENSLCRTQITMKVEHNPSEVCRDYFLKSPIGNHHVVFNGDQTDIFEAFIDSL